MRPLAILLLLSILVPIFPQAPGYPVLAFSSPDSSFSTITSLIGNASSFIYLAVYSFSNPRLLKALNEAIDRGVQVYVLLEDKHVSYYEDVYTLYAAYNLTQAGALVHRAPQDYRYMHAKYMVVDNESVLIFTGNFAKTGVPYDPSYGNRERGVIIYDPSVAKFFASVFLEDFRNGEPYDESQGTGESVSGHVDKGDYPHPFAPETFYVERIEPFVLPNASVLAAYISLIRSANESIDVEIAYADFRRDSIDGVNPLIQALIEAAGRGVNVRVIIGFYNDEQASVALYLRNHGVRVARGPSEDNSQDLPVDAYFASIHTKVMIIDGRIVVISSANRSENAFNNNREAGVIIRSQDLAEYFGEIFQRDREHSLIKPPIESQGFLSISVLEPMNGSVLKSLELEVRVNSSDPGVLKVYANGTLVYNASFPAGISVLEANISLAIGVREVDIVATSGNMVSKAKLFVRIYYEEQSEAPEEEEKRIPLLELLALIVLSLLVLYIKKRRRFFASAYTRSAAPRS